MAARVVRFHPDIHSIGIEPHDGLYYLALLNSMLAPTAPPWIPVPTGMMWQTVHLVEAPVTWLSLKDCSNPKVIADGAPIVSTDHTAQHTVHISPGINILLPAVIALGESGWKLGIGSVIATKGRVASTIEGATGLTIDCADPVSMPFGVFRSEGSVHVSPTAGDFAQVVVEWALTETVNLLVQAGLKRTVFSRKSTDPMLIPVEQNWVRRKLNQVFKPVSSRVGREYERRLGSDVMDDIGKLAREGSKKQIEKWGGDGAKDQLDQHQVGPEAGGKAARDRLKE